MRKIYIAGFNTSLPEVWSLSNKYKILCAKYGCKAVFPTTVDQIRKEEGRTFNTPLEEAQAIFRANLQKLDSADTIIANLDYYGNFYATSDTIFEMGYAYSKNKQIIGYYSHEYQAGYYALRGVITDQCTSEFGRPTNLMVACATSIIIQGDFEDCLELVLNGGSNYDGECKIYTISHHT